MTQNKGNKIYNYRFSGVHNEVENHFGIFANSFKIFRNTMLVNPKFADNIVLASRFIHYLICK